LSRNPKKIPVKIKIKKNLKMLPVLRGFSRNVKQDSEASSASGGMATMQPAFPLVFAAINTLAKKILKMLPKEHTF
jgi:hypothetical protein